MVYEFCRKLFPPLVDGKINTLEFLEASKGVLSLVSKFRVNVIPCHVCFLEYLIPAQAFHHL